MYLFPLIILFLLSFSFANEADKRAELLGTVQVSKVNSLDEAKGAYKSPKKAMFMSLLVPGSGQLYVGGQARYIRGTFYLAEEIALIAGLYYHSIHKYDKQVKKYRNFANKYFSVERYEKAMNGISIQDLPGNDNNEIFKTAYGSERDGYCNAIYGPRASGTDSKCVSFESGYDFYNSNYKEGMGFYDPSAYYRSIASENFVLGWDDVKSNADSVQAEINSLQTGAPFTYISLGKSEKFSEYLSMRSKATDLADRQAIFLGAIILNHIVSAIDAALSAKAHNSTLYEEKVSFLDKVRLNSNFTAGENFRTEAAFVYLF